MDRVLPRRDSQVMGMTKLHIAIPCFGGLMQAACARSVMDLTHELARNDVGWALDMELHESLVQRARNSLVHRFLKSDATHLLFIDADVQFRPVDVIGMLGADKPLVCGAYPKKTLDVQNIVAAVERREADPMSFAANYAINVLPPKGGEAGALVTSDNGCVPILDAPTGFMLVRREVFLEMAAALPETLYYSDNGMDRGEAKHAFFDCAIDENKRYLSEDYLFSRRWQRMGGTVWLFLPAKLAHVGSYTYRGDLYKTFQPTWDPNDASEYSLPEDNPDHGHLMVERYEWAAAHLKGDYVANACSGPGYGMPILRRDKPGRRVVNIDRSEECQRISRERNWVPFVLGDVTKMDLEGFDALCCLETLEHLPDPVGWLKQLHPNVKEIALSVPCVRTKHINAHHLHDFTYDGMLQLLQALDWEVKDHKLQCDDVIMAYAVRP